jgi:hypothetical protein
VFKSKFFGFGNFFLYSTTEERYGRVRHTCKVAYLYNEKLVRKLMMPWIESKQLEK